MPAARPTGLGRDCAAMRRRQDDRGHGGYRADAVQHADSFANTVAVRQWIDELLDKTTLTEDQVGEYTGLRKEIRPVTISTYQTMTYRKRGVKEARCRSPKNFRTWACSTSATGA